VRRCGFPTCDRPRRFLETSPDGSIIANITLSSLNIRLTLLAALALAGCAQIATVKEIKLSK